VDSRAEQTRDREQEAERYRRAAADALDQLQWCVNYLYRIRKDEIARAVNNNCAIITERSGIRR
jgi:hypothetical protein